MPELLNQPPGPATATPSALSRGNPFPGLKPYAEEDAAWFFGRSAEINELMKRLRRLHFVAVVGASGSGKSSLVRAGVLPQVRDGYLDADWLIATLRPGDHPLQNLAEALDPLLPGSTSSSLLEQLSSGSQGLVRALEGGRLTPRNRVLLLIDQFEELFQFAQRAGESATEEVKAFLKMLLAAANSDDVPVYVVITMRLEWLNECASYVGWAEAMNEGLYLVPQMSRQQFQRAILSPLDLAGGTITSSVVSRMLNDLNGRSDQLPVLQHALMRLWQRSGSGATLDGAAYDAVGTISQCLSAHAEEVFAELTPHQARVAEQIFRSITQIDRGRKVRRPRPLCEILASRGFDFTDAAAVITTFSLPGRSFLVTTEGPLTGDSVVDISHEALIRQWKRLSDWVENEAELHSRLQRLEDDAAEWNNDRKTYRSVLYRGAQLDRAQELLPQVTLTGTAAEFVRAAARARLVGRLRLQVAACMAALLAVAAVVYYLHESRERSRIALALATEQQKSAEDKANLAALQARKAQEFQANLVQQIDQAHGSAQALASIAQSIQAQRVYVQYTPDTAAAARTVQSQLRSKGYTVPGLEAVNVSKAPTQSQVRYFHPEDREGASKIAGLLRSFGGGLVPQNAANPGGVVPPGQFEVWLVASAAPAPSVAPTPVPTESKPAAAILPPVASVPTLTASVSDEHVVSGGSTLLTWHAENASEVNLEGYGRVPISGSMPVTPKETTTYRLTAASAAGITAKSLPVTVVPPPTPAPVQPAVSPTAAASSPVLTAASGTTAIKAALTRYREAYESESLDDIKRAWPTVPKAQQKTMKLIFDQFNAIKLSLNCPESDIHLEADAASAICRQSAAYTQKGQRLPAQSSTAHIRLRKAEGTWVIDSIE